MGRCILFPPRFAGLGRGLLGVATSEPSYSTTRADDHRAGSISHSTVIIIGAGITGIGAAYYLGANKISYTILERSPDVGGVWFTHRWHGARCDSEFIKYSFSFKPCLIARSRMRMLCALEPVK